MTVSTAGPYRPDIDGLRAVAVVAVMLFHAGAPGFGGGYIGVDVFFVISGYLITAQLLNTGGTSTRSMLAQFYLRRARRILPALFLVLAVVLVAGVFLFLPGDLARLGRDATLSVIFAGNIAAWQSANYFEAGPIASLLHLWTLAIEEQFYLFFPLSVWIAMKYFRRRHLVFVVAGCALASFATCIYGADAHPRANFYLAPSRAWELLLGAVLAIWTPGPTINRLTRELLAAAAAATILLAIILYDATLAYPYFATVAPCVATVVLIAVGAGGLPLANRALALRPLVFIGLISYSLYLWHVPVQTFFAYYNIRELTALQTVGWLGATFVLAAGSWALIEKPVRKRRLLQGNQRFVASMAVVAVALAAVGGLYWRSDGLPERIPVSLQAVLRSQDRYFADSRECMLGTPQRIAAGELCHYGSSDSSARRLLVWGDSHALALLPAFESLASEHDASLYFAGAGSCRPLIGVASRRQNEGARRKCEEYNFAMLAAIERLDPAVVIFASYWTHPDVDLIPVGAHRAGTEELFAAGLRNVLDKPAMHDRIACAVLDVPRLEYFVPSAYGRAVLRGLDTNFIAMEREQALQQLAPAEDALRRMHAHGELRLVDPKKLLCAASICRFDLPTGELLYGDDNHLNVRGAHFVEPTLEPCFR